MRISINEDYIRLRPGAPKRSQKESLQILKDCGFDTADFGMFCNGGDFQYDGKEDHIAWASMMREYADRIGIRINQSHVPFYEVKPMPEGYVEKLIRCVESSAVLGADCVVVHADTWYEPQYVQWDYDTVLNTIYDVFAPIVETAEKVGVKIAMETLFEVRGSLYHRTRFCSLIEELDDIVGKFNCDTVGVCWDFGHANMAYGKQQFQAMRKMKSKLIATHVHDNIAKYDNHNLPYMGNINWAEGLQTMADLGYEGDLTLEVGYGGFPDDLVKDYVKYAHRTAEYMVEQFESFK